MKLNELRDKIYAIAIATEKRLKKKFLEATDICFGQHYMNMTIKIYREKIIQTRCFDT